MGVKIAFGSRAESRGGEQMNGGQTMNGGGQMNYQNNGGQMMGGQMNYQNAMPQNAMNGGYGMSMSYPVQTSPPAYMPGHPVPVAPQAAQMGFLAPLDQMGQEGMLADMMEEMRRGRSARTGRFVHRSAMDRAEQMRGASSRGEDYEMGHAGADEDDAAEELRELKAKCKKLKKKVKKLEAKLEEKEESRSKKKKKGDDDDDEDDEDDPGAKLGCALSKLIPSLPGMAEAVFNVIADPPSTWLEYLKKGDLPGIAKMEFGELLKAVQDKKPLSDLKKEIMHTAAALLMVCGK